MTSRVTCHLWSIRSVVTRPSFICGHSWFFVMHTCVRLKTITEWLATNERRICVRFSQDGEGRIMLISWTSLLQTCYKLHVFTRVLSRVISNFTNVHSKAKFRKKEAPANSEILEKKIGIFFRNYIKGNVYGQKTQDKHCQTQQQLNIYQKRLLGFKR